MNRLLTRLLGDPHAKEIARARKIAAGANEYEEDYKKLSDAKLRAKTDEFKKRLSDGENLDALLPDAFAAVREASGRAIGLRHYDVQLIGGVILHEGKIAEMRTGEGKTLVATAPVYLNALEGKGVHVVTVNDYLARRDAGWMGRVYNALGLTTGIIIHDSALLYDPEFVNEETDDDRLRHLRPVTRADAYAADITYGTNNEFGFDFLRDNMVNDVQNMVQRPLNFAIVDEVDSILIDEARTPLIISAPADEATDRYIEFAKLARQMVKDEDYKIDEKQRAVSLTDEGIIHIEKILGVDNIYEAGRVEDVHHVEQSLKAEAIYNRDKDYVVQGGEIIIVDEFTGRLMHGRRYSEGLHQAIEAKENVQIRQESITLATITFQNFFRIYTKLAGMTGTAATEAEEFAKIYELEVTTIPTNRDMARRDFPDRIYKTELGKYQAVARDVAERHATGQPVLLGTVSIAKNELLSSLLHQAKIPHQVLNAKNNEREASIIAGAGQKGAVTLATNIAGRGTDIILGDGVADLGGLYVIGTERHESRRIDNQLRGRAGRQGDPGASRFYVSLEDDLMRIFGGERVAGLMNSLGIDEDVPLENAIVSRSLEGAQKKVEGHNFDIRKQLVEYDDVMNKHREVVYTRRRKALESTKLRPEIEHMLADEFSNLLTVHTDERTGIVETDKLIEVTEAMMPMDPEVPDSIRKADPRDIQGIMVEYAGRLYDARERQFGDEGMRLLERLVYLQILDRLWIEHLEAMDRLREGIGLRAIGQRDPLVEYKSEGFRLFKRLISLMEAEIAATIFRASIERQAEVPVETAMTRAAEQAATNAPLDEPAANRSQRRVSGATPSSGSKKTVRKRKKRK